MDLFLTTNRPANRQVTLKNLPPSWLARTFLVLSQSDYDSGEYAGLLEEHPTLRVLQHRERTLTRIRQWILERAEDVFCLLDDDLKFRTWVAHRKYRDSTPEEIDDKLEAMADVVKERAGGVVGGSLGSEFLEAFHEDGDHLYSSPAAPNRIMVLNKRVMIAEDICFRDAGPCCSDWHVFLSLLERGWLTVTLLDMVVKEVNSPGGCQAYRDKEVYEASLNRFVSLHPQFSSIRVTKNKDLIARTGTNLDLRVSWKKAYQWGKHD